MAGVLIEWPQLALVPALILLFLGSRTGRTTAHFAGLVWLFYAVYELGMKMRILCSGECNIRIDLLLIYPLLALVTLAGVGSAVWSFRSTHARR